jgi:hypothetical protein
MQKSHSNRRVKLVTAVKWSPMGVTRRNQNQDKPVERPRDDTSSVIEQNYKAGRMVRGW